VAGADVAQAGVLERAVEGEAQLQALGLVEANTP
jgi:hypothetical protein